MAARRFTLVVCLVALVTSCGSPSAPTEEPDVRGFWGGTPSSWNWSDSYTYSPGTSRTAACSGALEITSQDGGSFGGRYAIDCPASGRSSGAVFDGHINPNGQLLFRLRADEGWGPGLLPGWFDPPCRLSADPETYEGSVVNGSIAARRVQMLDCSSGRVLVTAGFQGVRR